MKMPGSGAHRVGRILGGHGLQPGADGEPPVATGGSGRSVGVTRPRNTAPHMAWTRDKEGKPAYGAGGRNPWEDFRGERRSNATHVSTTDPEALLALVHLRAPVHQPGVEARRIRRRLAWWRLSVLRVGARTALPPAMPSCHDRGVAGSGEPHSPPSHISKTVPPTVHLGPPDWTKSRTFTIRFALDP